MPDEQQGGSRYFAQQAEYGSAEETSTLLGAEPQQSEFVVKFALAEDQGWSHFCVILLTIANRFYEVENVTKPKLRNGVYGSEHLGFGYSGGA